MAAVINLKVKSDFAAASADLKKFGTVTESQRKKIEKFQNEFKDESIKKFIDRNNRATAAIKATRGPLAATTAQYKAYQRQIESLIKRGLDPESKEIKELTGRYKKLEKEIKDVTKAEKSQGKALGVTQGAMLAVGAGAVVMGKRAVAAFIDFSKESAQAASDAEEVAGKFNVVFRSVGDEANRMSESLADDFDLASSTAQQLLSDTGDLLTGFGLTGKAALDLSDETNRLAIDLASFTNAQGGAAAVSAALTKSYAGERESLKTYGIVISEADVKARLLEDAQNGLTFENEKAAKAYATLSLATEQSKNAIGDYARTSDSAANVSRRLEESEKALQEAFGVTINQGLTPLKAILADVVKEWADLLVEQEKVRESIRAFEEGTANAEQTVEALNERLISQVIATKALNDAQGLNIAGAAEAVKANERNIEQTRIQLAQAARAAALDARGAEALKEKAAIQAKVDAARKVQDDLHISAAEKLEELRVASLSADEKEIESLNLQIDRWVSVRSKMDDTADAQKIINILIEDRNALQGKSIEGIETEQTAIVKAGEDWLSIEQAKIEHLIFIDELETEISEKRLAEAKMEADAADALSKKKIDNVFKFANAAMGVANAIDGLMSANAAAELQRLEDAGASEEDLAQKKKEIARDEAIRGKALALTNVAIDTASAVIGFLSNPGGIAGIALSGLAAVTGGIQAAAINAAPIPSFQTGTGLTPFTVPESAASSRADSQRIAVNPGEDVTVSPRGEGGRSITTIVEIDGEVIYNVVNRGVESGEIRITADNIQGGAAVA